MATVFEIAGSIALYRKPYTTTSTVSFPIPPPTAVAGLIACIVGIDNGSEKKANSAQYWKEMNGTRIAIQRLNVNAWFSAALNFSNPKEPQKNPHIQIRHQFVRNPRYRIFVQDGLETRLDEYLRTGRSYFTPVLGAAYALADLAYCGQFDFEKELLSGGEKDVPVSSVVPLMEDTEASINFLASKGMLKDEFPFRLNQERALVETIRLLYPISPSHRIILTPWKGLDITHFRDEYIAWLPAW
jgi:CRISPR-associated protein Cas5h